ncbi:hypothetical protein ACJX0J_038814 [Zea mays]
MNIVLRDKELPEEDNDRLMLILAEPVDLWCQLIRIIFTRLLPQITVPKTTEQTSFKFILLRASPIILRASPINQISLRPVRTFGLAHFKELNCLLKWQAGILYASR